MSVSPSRSPVKSKKNEGFGRISAPFVKDTAVIVEKFVESVKDLFHYCYTDKDLYNDIHRMNEDELFANLSEYLEDIKFAMFEALSENLDKISLKFLQICDKPEKFNKYLKVLKDKWKGSSTALKGHHRHDDKYIRSAKDFVNKLADGEIDSRRSRKSSRIRPQTHVSEFQSINRTGTPSKSSHRATQQQPAYHDMPIVANQFSTSRSQRAPAQSSRSIRQPQSPSRTLQQSQDPQQPTRSPSKGISPGKRAPRAQAPPQPTDGIARLIEKREEHASFTRDIINPHTGRNPSLTSVYKLHLPD